VTFVYLGGQTGEEHQAQWRVTLEAKKTVTALNEAAKDAEDRALMPRRERRARDHHGS
jgi:hypothetical protein